MTKRLWLSAALLVGLAHPVLAQSQSDWASLVQTDPGAYVRALQENLQQRNEYDGPLSGLLTRSTINALQQYCDEAGIGAVCAAGPLRAEAANALSIAFGVTAPKQVAGAATQLPRDWHADIRDGLTLEIVTQTSANGTDFWDVRIHGTPDKAGWSNLELLPRTRANNTDAFEASVSGMVVESDPRTMATFDVAVKAPDFKYLGSGDIDRKIKPELTTYTLSGDLQKFVPEVDLTPYVQFIYAAGEPVDMTVRLSAADLSITP